MATTIKKISELEQLTELSSSSNVIIEENGKAKRIAASNFAVGGSGGGVSSWNDLTDKPFDYTKASTLLEKNVTLTTDGGAPFAYAELTEVVTPEAGKVYVVSFGGAEYVCAARYGVIPDMAVLGNTTILEIGEDTGEPFMFVPITVSGESEGCTICGKEATTVDFGLYEIEITKKLNSAMVSNLPVGFPDITSEEELDCIMISGVDEEAHLPVWKSMKARDMVDGCLDALFTEADATVVPRPSNEDNGKVLGVVDGWWDFVDASGGSSVQPDLAQNDPTQPDYVKGRTHWEENNQTVIEWDGSTEGRTVIDLSGDMSQYLVHVSDLTPTYDEIDGGLADIGDVSGNVASNLPIVSETDVHAVSDELYNVSLTSAGGPTLMFVASTPCEVEGLTFPLAGVYFCVDQGAIPQKLTYGSTTVHQLDEKFIPDSVKLPAITTENNGAFLRVIDGEYTLVNLTDVSTEGA